MTRKYTKRIKSEEEDLADENKNGKRKRITINMNKYPDLYDKLSKLSYINVRTIEQQALFYIIQAVGETEVGMKKGVNANKLNITGKGREEVKING